jgi:hypothetical protein
MKLDRDHRLTGKGEAFRQMPLQRHGIGQEACRDGEPPWAALRVGRDVGW